MKKKYKNFIRKIPFSDFPITLYKKINLVITPSDLYKQKLRDSGVFDCDIIHIPNFLPEGTEFKNVRNGGDYFLYFGRLSIEKGILVLIKAYAKAKVKKPLYLVGTGPEEEIIRKFIKKHNLESKIIMLGFKKGDELRQLVQNALCVCLLSTWYENGPYTIMEAQAAGRPALVSNIGGIPEMVIDTVNGRIAMCTGLGAITGLLEYCENKEDWNYDGIVEYAAKKYNAEEYVDRIISLYSSLIDSFSESD